MMVPYVRAIIHTGFCGCGAFGGNRIVMTLLQALAADLADVDVVFHAADETGESVAGDAYSLYQRLRSSATSVPALVDAIIRQGFVWGRSDGN